MVFSNRDECNVDVFGMAERNNKSVPWVQGPFCASVTRNAGSMESSAVSYTHLRAHETRHDLVCRLLLEKKKKITNAVFCLNI